MQGVSWKGLAAGHKPAKWRDSFFAEYYKELGNVPACYAIRSPTHKLVKYPGHPEWTEVFDLSADPYEVKNLASDERLINKLAEQLARLAKGCGPYGAEGHSSAEIATGRVADHRYSRPPMATEKNYKKPQSLREDNHNAPESSAAGAKSLLHRSQQRDSQTEFCDQTLHGFTGSGKKLVRLTLVNRRTVWLVKYTGQLSADGASNSRTQRVIFGKR